MPPTTSTRLGHNPNRHISFSLQLQGELQAKSEAVKKYKGVLHGVKVILQNEGPRGLFRGIGSAVRACDAGNGASLSDIVCSIYIKFFSTVAVSVSTSLFVAGSRPLSIKTRKSNPSVLMFLPVPHPESLELPQAHRSSSSKPVFSHSHLSSPSAHNISTGTRSMVCGKSTLQKELVGYTVE